MNLCKSAASSIDRIKTEQMQIDMQKQLINRQQDQIDSVQKTVKREIKSWANVKTVKEAMRSVNEEEERSRNLIIYGVKETKEGEWEDIFNVDIHNSKRNFIRDNKVNCVLYVMFTFFIYVPILRSLFYIACI